jgi:hypothetical protein
LYTDHGIVGGSGAIPGSRFATIRPMEGGWKMKTTFNCVEFVAYAAAEKCVQRSPAFIRPNGIVVGIN